MGQTIKATYLNYGTVIVTKNVDGSIYVITAEYINNILDDWNEECDFVPENDARVFFAVWNGEPVSPYDYKDFESLLMLLKDKLK